jgi:hypothetical protein
MLSEGKSVRHSTQEKKRFALIKIWPLQKMQKLSEELIGQFFGQLLG